MTERKVGVVFGYYKNISVAAIKLEGSLKVGDKIHIRGASTDFQQTVDSMQIEHDKVEEAKKGQEVGIKVADRVRNNDVVYVVS